MPRLTNQLQLQNTSLSDGQSELTKIEQQNLDLETKLEHARQSAQHAEHQCADLETEVKQLTFQLVGAEADAAGAARAASVSAERLEVTG